MTVQRDVFVGTTTTGVEIMLDVFSEGGEVLERSVSTRNDPGDLWSAPTVLESTIEPPC